MLLCLCLRMCILKWPEKYFRSSFPPAVPYPYSYFIFVVVSFYKIYFISHVSMGKYRKIQSHCIATFPNIKGNG